MATLNKQQSETFLEKVADGLKNPIGPIPTPKVDKAIADIMDKQVADIMDKQGEDPKTPFLCKISLHFYKDKLVLDFLNVKNGKIPFRLHKMCKKCGYVKDEVIGTMSYDKDYEHIIKEKRNEAQRFIGC